ncbi:hypothetical protein O3M35_005953 [Rhynocoris fuscipes]|uniref:V-type proton ATPase subunit n=1 Tax=Rhynocoris fuscipes TaxID=488301 RepID=A0AAW1DE27_9HEMI
MGYQVIPLAVISAFWLIVGFIVPWFIPNGPNKGVIVWMLILTSVCAWFFWIVNYLAQMNPLIGPALKRNVVLMMASEWVS